MEQNIKKELIKSVDSIKHKIRDMRNVEDETNLAMEKILKPVSKPLTTFIKQNSYPRHGEVFSIDKEKESDESDTSTSYEDTEYYDSNLSDISKFDFKQENTHFTDFIKKGATKRGSLEKDDLVSFYETIGVNIPFGIRNENKQLYMGSSSVKMSKTDNALNNDPIYYVSLDDKTYELTPGIRELLLKKTPDLTLVSDIDKLVYKDMLSISNVHKRDFDPNGQIKGDKSLKYRDIIKPLLLEPNHSTINLRSPIINSNTAKQGGSLPKLKKYKSNTDLIYWDDPNELVERLKILIASRNAGNGNHDNEILAIVEELKEAGIIKA